MIKIDHSPPSNSGWNRWLEKCTRAISPSPVGAGLSCTKTNDPELKVLRKELDELLGTAPTGLGEIARRAVSIAMDNLIDEKIGKNMNLRDDSSPLEYAIIRRLLKIQDAGGEDK